MNKDRSFYQGKNVLVAGGAGLIGQGLIRKLLEEGACVRATEYKKRRITLEHTDLEVVTCDLGNPQEAQAAFKDMEIAFLTAAWVGAAKAVRDDPSALIMYNLDLQSKMIGAAAKARLDRCGFVSSTYVYPDTGRPNVEEEGFQGDPWIPVNYGLGWVKRYLETLCTHFHMTSSTDYAIVRPATVYGPCDHFDLEAGHAIPALITRAADRQDPFEVWGTGRDVRSFIYVDDLAEGFLRTLEKYPVAEALNLSHPKPATIHEVVQLLLEALEFHPQVAFHADKPSAVPYKVSDPSRARELLGWEARVSLKEGLKKTIDWYLDSQRKLAPMEVSKSAEALP